jgi:hypothetical protein
VALGKAADALEAAQARIAALEAELAVVQGWQGIESAPRGARLLLFGSTLHDSAVIFSGYKARNGTLYSDGGAWCAPTHWMPLPTSLLQGLQSDVTSGTEAVKE